MSACVKDAFYNGSTKLFSLKCCVLTACSQFLMVVDKKAEKFRTENIKKSGNYLDTFLLNLKEPGPTRTLMLMSRYVRIYYGPYEEFFTNSHKPQKIKGLTDALLKHGYRVHLIPVDFVNCCIIEVLGVEVFRCNIRNLCFNVPHEDDIVCQRALAAVKDASKRIRRANSHFWMHTVFKQILTRNEYTPKACWPFDIAIKPMTSVEKCIECCGILVTKKKPPGEEVNANEIDITGTVKDDDEPKESSKGICNSTKDAVDDGRAEGFGEVFEEHEEFMVGEKEIEDKTSLESKGDETQVDFEMGDGKEQKNAETENGNEKLLVNLNIEVQRG